MYVYVHTEALEKKRPKTKKRLSKSWRPVGLKSSEIYYSFEHSKTLYLCSHLRIFPSVWDTSFLFFFPLPCFMSLSFFYFFFFIIIIREFGPSRDLEWTL